jgi:ABC-type Zn uptake system ZnuABC Zn-binding protein ZnuA
LPDAQEPLAGAEVARRRFLAGLAGLAGPLAFALPAARAFAAGPVRLVATTATLASLAEAVGGERVAITTLVAPNLDVEEYQPRPRDLERLREADALLRVGVDYDLWLDRLLAQAGNPRLARGAPGYIDGALGISLLEVRGLEVGPGHAHGSGNPHYWMDPANAEVITGNVLVALAKLDPAGAKRFEQRRSAFLATLDAKRVAWEATMAPFRGRAFVAYHNAWAYFARRFRLQGVGIIEAKAGVPPAPSHLAALLKAMREKDVRVILREPHEPAKDADYLARGTGATVLALPASVGAIPEATDYLALFDHDVNTLAGGVAMSRGPENGDRSISELGVRLPFPIGNGSLTPNSPR